MIDALHIFPTNHQLDAGLSAAVTGLATAQRRAGLAASLRAADATPFGRRGQALLAAAARHQPTILHSHGLWLAPSQASRRWRRRGGATVVTPHGMLDPWTWKRRWRLKKLLWRLGEAETLTQASCLHALCPAEAVVMRELGLANPIAVIPNGVEPPDRSTPLPPPPWAGLVPEGAPVLLFLGRFHHKKGLDALLAAWRKLQDERPADGGSGDWWLVFVGFGDDGALARQLQQDPVAQCLALGPVFGRERDSAYAHASGFVLPSFSEGLPLAALEAMSWGLPTLLSPYCNLPEAFGCGAAWSVEPQAVQLSQQLGRFCRSSDGERAAMARAGQQLVAEQYSWQQVAERCRRLYGWIAGGGEPPAFLHPPA